MASIFRSEPMALCQLFLSTETVYNCVAEIGEIGLVQFRDLNPNVNAFQRKFTHEVRRCEEMERQLRFIENEMQKACIKITDLGENPETPQPKEMIDLEATFEKLENELKEVNANAETLQRNFLELTELKNVLQITEGFFHERDFESASSLSQNLITQEPGGTTQPLGFVAGVIAREKVAVFERLLWRVCRGNVFVRQEEISQPLEDPATGDSQHKVVYVIFFQGERLKSKVKKICDGCHSTMYPCPELASDRKEMLEGVKNRLQDLAIVLSQTTDHRQRVLEAAAKHIRVWFIKARKMKAVFHTMNFFNFDVTTKCMIAEAWIPEADLSLIKVALSKGMEKSGSSIQPILNMMPTNVAPPTFHRTNKFTSAFQALIDAYGVATYREVNPGLYTIATFPFLFGVMFGDFGHGIIMVVFALWMVLWEKSLQRKNMNSEIWEMFFAGRYLLLMMGIFSIYTGLIYNDIYSLAVDFFGSHWHVGTRAQEVIFTYHVREYMLDPAKKDDYDMDPYPFGIDPVWQISINKITFLNSYKMKISVILGIAQMVFGVILSAINHVHFRRMLNMTFEFIPQMIFLCGLFGYLCFLISYKWIMYGAAAEFGSDRGTRCAPSILILYINMFLMNSDGPMEGCTYEYMFTAQQTLQTILVIVAVVCVPVMLLPKPLILRSRHIRKMKALSRHANSQDVEQPTYEVDDKGGDVHEEEAEFEFGEVFIHQVIHTIEFTLGCVSHTASYLRLWALSLAHAELAEVLWKMVLAIGLSMNSRVGCIWIFLLFAAWAFLTLFIMVLMEALSAFLHCLRLHWVEFCSKFYTATGYPFLPFSFKHFLEGDSEF